MTLVPIGADTNPKPRHTILTDIEKRNPVIKETQLNFIIYTFLSTD